VAVAPAAILRQFKVKLDKRGERDERYRCKHVNFVQNSHVPDEREFLFAPYSVFVVEEVVLQENSTYLNPHRITLRYSSRASCLWGNDLEGRRKEYEARVRRLCMIGFVLAQDTACERFVACLALLVLDPAGPSFVVGFGHRALMAHACAAAPPSTTASSPQICPWSHATRTSGPSPCQSRHQPGRRRWANAPRWQVSAPPTATCLH
jgi:hypothetical protein